MSEIKRPTIQELNEILSRPDSNTVRFMPDGQVFVDDELDKKDKRIAELEAEVERLHTMSIVEMMCENESVRAHVTEWEGRCMKAEAEVDQLRAALRRLIEHAANHANLCPCSHGSVVELRKAVSEAAALVGRKDAKPR